MVHYTFKPDEVVAIKNAKKADPQILGEELERIRIARGGELTPAAVLAAAEDQNSPLHAHFEWDDAIAADAYRLDQARGIIRLVRVSDQETEDGTARAFISIRSDKGVSYRSLTEVQQSADLRAAVLAQAEKDLDAFARRYKEMKDVMEHVEKAREVVRSRRRVTGKYAEKAAPQA